MKKVVAILVAFGVLATPLTSFAATSSSNGNVLTQPGSQIQGGSAASPSPITNNSSLEQQLTYVRSNMELQAQWFLYVSTYLKQVSEYVLKVQPDKTSITGTIDAYAASLQKVSDDMKSRQQVIPIEQAITLSGFGLHIMSESLILAATSLNDVKGVDTFFFPSMALICESLRSVGDNIMAIGYLGTTTNGNINVAAYQQQMESAVFLYQALQSLFTSRDRASEVKADLQSNQASRASNSTFQVINFDASASQDPIGTIPNPKGYFWDFGDGSFAVGPFVSHTYTQPGNYLVKLMVQSASGFSAATSEVKIVPVYPVAVIVTDQDSLLGPVPDEVTLTAKEPITLSGLSSYDPSTNAALKLTWDFGDGKQNTGADNSVVTHVYDVPGEYELVLRAENGQLAGVAKKKVKVLASPPVIKLQIRSATQPAWSNPDKMFFSQSVFGPTAFDFTAQDSVGALVPGFNARTQIVQAEWDFGDGTPTVTQNQSQLNAREKVTHTYEKAGNFNIVLKLTDEAQNAGQMTKVLILSENNVPAADFDFQHEETDAALTTATRIRFDAANSTAAQGSVSRFNWRITSATNETVFTSTDKNFFYQFPKPGRYEVSLQVTTNLGITSSRVSQRFFVESSAPQASYTYTFYPYIPNRVDFDASASADPDTNDTLLYSWDFESDGVYDVVGTKDPKLSKVLDKVGVNTVTLQVSDSAGLIAEAKQDITITSLLVASMKIPANSRAIGPAPLNVTFEGNGFRSLSTRNDSNTITKFSWDFGDGSPVLESTEIDQGVQLREHTYTQPGRYIATLKVEDREGEHAVAAYPVHVGNGQEPIAAIVYSPSFPLDGSIATLFTFDGSASVNALGGEDHLDYAWDFGDSTPLLSDPQVTHQYTKVGTYTVTLTITDSQASKIHRTQVQAVVKAIPPQARMVVSPRTGSAPLTVQFDASATEYIGGQITEYNFDYGDGTNALTRTPQSSHIYKQPGTYKVQLKVRASDGAQATSEMQLITITL